MQQDTFTSTTHHDIYPYISPSGRLAGSMVGKTILITGGGRGVGKVLFFLELGIERH